MTKELIKQIILEYQELIAKIELVNRDISVEEKGNYVFVGARRSGKTFTMFQIIKDLLANSFSSEQILYINFEDERLIELKVEGLALIIDSYKELFDKTPVLFLDEIQVIDGWEKFVRRLADTGYQLYVTGSNAKMLSKEIATTLGGRFLIREVFPFSFKEFLKANLLIPEKNWEYSSQRFEIRRLFDSYFRFGGFPELIRFQNKRIWLENLYKKIFYGDLIARYKIRNDFALKLTIKKLVESIHDEISFNRIKNIIQLTGIKVGTATVIDYISFLEESYLVFGLENYLAKISEKASRKKYYFVDNGIISLFLNSPETILLENLVACKLKQLYGSQLYYVKAQTEVDFYIPSKKTLIQVAYNIQNPETEKREADSLIKILPLLEADKLMIITLDQEKILEYGGYKIEIVPVWKWLLIS